MIAIKMKSLILHAFESMQYRCIFTSEKYLVYFLSGMALINGWFDDGWSYVIKLADYSASKKAEHDSMEIP